MKSEKQRVRDKDWETAQGLVGWWHHELGSYKNLQV